MGERTNVDILACEAVKELVSTVGADGTFSHKFF